MTDWIYVAERILHDENEEFIKDKVLVSRDDLDTLFKQIEKDNKYSIFGDTPEWIKIKNKYEVYRK